MTGMKLRVIDNPPNPYESRHVEWLEPPPTAPLRVYEETARSILSENDSPDLSFRWSVNPYRGCQHACAYCYARPYHEYLGFGAGTDFDTKLVAKINAADLLDQAFRKRTWKHESVSFSGITDCYQPLEASYALTCRCLEVCVAHRNAASVVTKSALVVRDIDVLQDLSARAGTRVYVSIPFADHKHASLMEPQAATPSRRFAAIRKLADAGVPTGLLIAPVIPGLNDKDIPTICARAAAAGANVAGMMMLRLPGPVRTVFLKRLHEALPLRAGKVLHNIRSTRNGQLNNSQFNQRMKGEGPVYNSIRRLFEIAAERHGLLDKHELTRPRVEAGSSPYDDLLRYPYADVKDQMMLPLGDPGEVRMTASRPPSVRGHPLPRRA